MQIIDPARSCLALRRALRGHGVQRNARERRPISIAAWLPPCSMGRSVASSARTRTGASAAWPPKIGRIMLGAAVRAQREAPGRYGGLLVRADAVGVRPRHGCGLPSSRVRPHGTHRAASEWALGHSLLDALVKHGSSDQRELGRADRGLRPSALTRSYFP